MESLVHQMAAQSVGHMDEARPWTGGGQWFAHLVSATVAFSSGSTVPCAVSPRPVPPDPLTVGMAWGSIQLKNLIEYPFIFTVVVAVLLITLAISS